MCYAVLANLKIQFEPQIILCKWIKHDRKHTESNALLWIPLLT